MQSLHDVPFATEAELETAVFNLAETCGFAAVMRKGDSQKEKTHLECCMGKIAISKRTGRWQTPVGAATGASGQHISSNTRGKEHGNSF